MPDLISDVRLDGQTIIALASRTPAAASVAVIERGGYGAPPWLRRSGSPLPSAGYISPTPPGLHRDVLVLKRFVLEPSLVLRRQDGGTWELDQILDADIVGIDRGVLLGRSPTNSGPPANRTYADLGTAPNRWVLLSAGASDPTPPHAVASSTVFDHSQRVLVGFTEIPNPTPTSAPPPVTGARPTFARRSPHQTHRGRA